ncbi:MAG TPA: OmpH family outer membrane protein, partial [Longimicrobiales bacterium]|nr:OmpH family outer membrane protein [Longimicrobiales bacterium]
MHRLAFLTAGMLLLGAGGLSAQQAGLKIGYINSQSILDEAPGAQEARDQFNQEMEGVRAEVQQMGQQLDELIQQYEQQQLTLSPQAKEQREQAILTKRQDYQARVQELEEQADQRQQELVKPVMDRITRVI